MRSAFVKPLLLVSLIVMGLFSCSDEKEELPVTPLSDYLPISPGKFITYRIDSLVPTQFNLGMEVHSYQVRHVVDAEITDNTGRPSYRIFRFLNNADGTGDWIPNGSYQITRSPNGIEVIEDNLRFLKLQQPVRDGYTWKGNRYLPSNAYGSFGHTMANDDLMRNWDYVYDFSSSTFDHAGYTYNDVISVEQEDDQYNIPIEPGFIAYVTRSVDRYSKNIGLVYREYTLWEYQPNLTGPNPTYNGFGITMWMVDHN